jgi:hypothetical protein
MVAREWNAYTITALALTGGSILQSWGGFRPAQWSGYQGPFQQKLYLATNIAGYFFDAVLREEHVSTLRITEHPVQTGANISDHAYQMPAHLVLEIGMSDAMSSLSQGQYSGGAGGKSVTAYQKLLELQAARVPLKVVTRLNVYKNMIIEQISSPVDARTTYGMRARVTLKQIILATVMETTAVSAAPNTTDATNSGSVQPATPAPSTTIGGYGGLTGTADASNATVPTMTSTEGTSTTILQHGWELGPGPIPDQWQLGP